jgi:Zn-dependent protease
LIVENNLDEQGRPQMDRAQAEMLTGSLLAEENFGLAVVAGLLAALISAVAWAGITVVTGYQIGIAAIGVGYAVAAAVRIAGKGLTSKFRLLGAALSLLGCLMGNLFTIFYFGAKEAGMPIMEFLPLIDLAMIPAILINTSSGMDLVFYGIAVYEGYKLSLRQIRAEEMASVRISAEFERAEGSALSPPQRVKSEKAKHSALYALIVLIVGLALKFKWVVAFALTKAKSLLLALNFLKFGAVLKTGLSMVVCIWAYALNWGWAFAAGFVLLIFVHEMGHAVALRYFGIKSGVPLFIPFVGAFIAMKELPHNVRIEAWTGIAGPLLGTAGAVVCWGVAHYTGDQFWYALAYTGFFINIFNLIPLSPLDGGRTVAAISPKIWVFGFIGILLLFLQSFNPILLFILIISGGKAFAQWKNKEERDEEYYKVSLSTKVFISLIYFGLIGFLAGGMSLTHFTV